MAEGNGYGSGRFPGGGIRRRGRARSRSKDGLGGDFEGSEKISRPRQSRQDLGKRNLGELFKGKGKEIRTIVPPFLEPLIPPGLRPTTSPEIITTVPTPEPVLSTSPPDPPITTETPITETAPTIVTLTPIAEPPPETTTVTATPILIPVFPPPLDLVPTDTPIPKTPAAQLPPVEVSTTQISISTSKPFISQTLPPESDVSSAALSSSITTFITLTSSTTATASLGIPTVTYNATSSGATAYTPNPAGRTAGIVVGTILGVAVLIALVLFWLKRRRRNQADAVRASTPAGISLLPAGKCFDVKSRGFSLGVWFHHSSGRQSSNKQFVVAQEIEKSGAAPALGRRQSTRRFDEPIPNITLTAASEEDGREQQSRGLGPGRGGQSTRIVISRIFPRQQSPRSSFLADPVDRQPSDSTSEPSRSNTPFRNSAMSEASSTWMTTATQKTDGEFVPTTALRYPRVLPKARQGPGEMPVPSVPGPSRWLSPPSWRVMARRSLTRSQKSMDDEGPRRSRGSPSSRAPGSSGSDKSLSEKGGRR